MTQPILKWRRVAALRQDHLAQSRRLLSSCSWRPPEPDWGLTDARLYELLVTSRALPLVVDVLSDIRSGVRAERGQWRTVRIHQRTAVRPSEPMWMAATYMPGSSVVHVAMFKAQDNAPHPRFALARLEFELVWPETRPMDVSIQRFRVP